MNKLICYTGRAPSYLVLWSARYVSKLQRPALSLPHLFFSWIGLRNTVSSWQ